jgi:hypothetical protein
MLFRSLAKRGHARLRDRRRARPLRTPGPSKHGDKHMTKLNTRARNRLTSSDFAEPNKRAYPVEDKAHARNAKARASQATNAGRMSKVEERKIDKKADAVLKKG